MHRAFWLDTITFKSRNPLRVTATFDTVCYGEFEEMEEVEDRVHDLPSTFSIAWHNSFLPAVPRPVRKNRCRRGSTDFTIEVVANNERRDRAVVTIKGSVRRKMDPEDLILLAMIHLGDAIEEDIKILVRVDEYVSAQADNWAANHDGDAAEAATLTLVPPIAPGEPDETTYEHVLGEDVTIPGIRVA